jgi:hypothetical protein
MNADIIRFPGMREKRNAEARADWYRKFYNGAHFPDMRSVEQYRLGEWLALQVSWLRRGYKLIDKPKPKERASRAKVFFDKVRSARRV